MTKTIITEAHDSIEISALSLQEIEAVAGGMKSLGGVAGGLSCFPIFKDDGYGGTIVISPTLGPLARIRF